MMMMAMTMEETVNEEDGGEEGRSFEYDRQWA